MLQNINKLLSNQKISYLIVGGLNTLFGYLASNALYYTLYDSLHITAIGLIASVINITFSFASYKLLVFRTKGGWLGEYLRCYAVYGLAAALSIAAVWVLVDFLRIPFWLGQGLVIGLSVGASYLGHSRFTFARGRRGGEANMAPREGP